MPSRSELEREKELASIWGEKQLAKRNEQETKKIKLHEKTGKLSEAAVKKIENDISDDGDLSDASSVISFVSDTALDPEQRKKRAEKIAAQAGKKKGKDGATKKRRDAKYRLHCFIAPGTNRNDVRAVFEDYGEPDVELRTSQKGNALNKTHFAVLTFKKKTHALFAARHLDGSNQRDTIGMNPMELSIFLSREQQRLVKKKAKKAVKKLI